MKFQEASIVHQRNTLLTPILHTFSLFQSFFFPCESLTESILTNNEKNQTLFDHDLDSWPCPGSKAKSCDYITKTADSRNRKLQRACNPPRRWLPGETSEEEPRQRVLHCGLSVHHKTRARHRFIHFLKGRSKRKAGCLSAADPQRAAMFSPWHPGEHFHHLIRAHRSTAAFRKRLCLPVLLVLFGDICHLVTKWLHLRNLQPLTAKCQRMQTVRQRG